MPKAALSSDLLAALVDARVQTISLMELSFEWHPPSLEDAGDELIYSASGKFYDNANHKFYSSFYYFEIERKNSSDDNFTLQAKYFTSFKTNGKVSHEELPAFYSHLGRSLVWPQFARMSETILADADIAHDRISLTADKLLVTAVKASGPAS